MTTFIKMQSGPQFTKKLEGMLNDFSVAHEVSKAYEQHLQKAQAAILQQGHLDFAVTILTTSYWPTYKQFPDFQIPREVEPSMVSFAQFYQTKYERRQLKWCFSLGSATVNAKFPQSGRAIDCVVGTFQMCIIMLFNAPGPSGALSVKQIKEALKIDDDTC